jgi:hypothetical protein
MFVGTEERIMTIVIDISKEWTQPSGSGVNSGGSRQSNQQLVNRSAAMSDAPSVASVGGSVASSDIQSSRATVAVTPNSIVEV